MKVEIVLNNLIKFSPLHQLAPVVSATSAFSLVKHFFMGVSK